VNVMLPEILMVASVAVGVLLAIAAVAAIDLTFE